MSTSMSTLVAEASPGPHADSSAKEWGFEALPSNVTFVNATMNGTIVNGRLYNGSDSSIASNDTTIVHTLSSNSVGSVSLVSFIYIIMSCVILIAMLPNGVRLIQNATKGRGPQSSTASATYTDRKFRRDLSECYPQAPTKLLPSYPELIDEKNNGPIDHKNIEWCKTLLRGKYSLDRQAASLQHVHRGDRHIVDGIEARSAGAAQELHGIARTWMTARDQWTAEEWELVKKICNRISTIESKGR